MKMRMPACKIQQQELNRGKAEFSSKHQADQLASLKCQRQAGTRQKVPCLSKSASIKGHFTEHGYK